jgi:hypothetical protein
MINEDKLNEAYGKMVVSEKEFFKRSEVEQTVNPEYYEDAMAGIDIELGDMMDWMYDVAITFAPTKDLDKIKMDMVSIMKYINSHKELYTKKDLENYEYSYSKFTNMSKKANDLIAKQRKLMDKLDASIQNKMKSIRSKYVKEGVSFDFPKPDSYEEELLEIAILRYIGARTHYFSKESIEESKNYDSQVKYIFKYIPMTKEEAVSIFNQGGKTRRLINVIEQQFKNLDRNEMKSIRSKYVKEGLENYNSQLEIEDILKKNMNKIISVGFIIPINDVRYVVKSYNYGKTFTITKYGDKKVSYESINIRLLSNWLEKRQYNN